MNVELRLVSCLCVNQTERTSQLLRKLEVRDLDTGGKGPGDRGEKRGGRRAREEEGRDGDEGQVLGEQ